MRKKNIISIIIIVIISITSLVFIPRSMKQMERIAYREFKNILSSSGLELEITDFEGPVIAKSKILKGYQFTWFKILPFSDTARFNINVDRNLSLGTTNTANYCTNYLNEPRSKVTWLTGANDRYNEEVRIKLHEMQARFYRKDSLPYLVVESKKLIYLINNGYFNRILQIDNNTNIVLFHEPIGYVEVSENIDIRRKELTMGARIINCDSLELLVEPTHIHDSIYNNLVYKKDKIEYMPSQIN